MDGVAQQELLEPPAQIEPAVIKPEFLQVLPPKLILGNWFDLDFDGEK